MLTRLGMLRYFGMDWNAMCVGVCHCSRISVHDLGISTDRLSVYHVDYLQFVAHPNVQQLLASIWYEGLPGFRRKNMVLQALEIVRIGIGFPVFSAMYILAPHSKFGQTLRKPFIKFICHSASYFTFLCEYTLYMYI
jgi:hypothetical protein